MGVFLKALGTVLMAGVFVGVGGCASVERSVVLGAGIGGATGALIGTAARDRPSDGTSIVVGALVGSLTGGLFGYLGFQGEQDKMKAMSMKSPEEQQVPFYLKDATTQRIWVPTRIEGNKRVWGHYVDIIERPAVWEVRDDKQTR